jgi:glutamine synthetase
MKSLGFDTFNVGPELEYFLFEDDKDTKTLDEGGYFAMTGAGRRHRGAQRHDPRARVGRHPDRVPPPRGRPVAARDRHALRRRARDGRPLHDVPADREGGRGMARLLRDLHAEAALRRERVGHAHAHVAVQERRNQFFDAKDPHHLSKTAKAFIAGLLVHAREMSAVLAQWVNSYKRLVPGFEAPVYVAWSQRNRSALIRIPLYKPGEEQATRAEIRCPDPACNPYLAFAALLHAGLEGIERGYELPDEMTTNLYRLSDEEREEQGVEALPGSLGRPSRRSRARSSCRVPSASTSSRATSSSSGASGRVPRSRSPSGRSGATSVPCSPGASG